MKIMLFGTGASAHEFLRAARETPGVEVVRIVTSSSDPMARHHEAEVDLFDRLSEQDLLNRAREAKPDVLMSVTSPYLFKDAWLELPKVGAFNLHPSALPRFAGFYPFVWSIIQGATEHGVTVHRMTPRVDAGAIVGQSRFPISAKESGVSLYMKCVKATPGLARELLSGLTSGSLKEIPQDLSQRSYFRKRVPLDGKASFSWEAPVLERAVRAFSFAPFPSPIGALYVELSTGQKVSLDAVELDDGARSGVAGTLLGYDGDDALIACGSGCLRVRRLERRPARELLEQAGASMSSQAFSA